MMKWYITLCARRTNTAATKRKVTLRSSTNASSSVISLPTRIHFNCRVLTYKDLNGCNQHTCTMGTQSFQGRAQEAGDR